MIKRAIKFIPFDIERVGQNRLEQFRARGRDDINQQHVRATARTLARYGHGVNRPIIRASTMAHRESR